MKKVFLVDVDDTLINMIPKWKAWFKEKTGEELDLTKDFLNEYNDHSYDPFDWWRDPHLYDDMIPMDDAVDVLKYFSDKFDYVAVSHCMIEHEKSKRAFIKKHFPFFAGFIDTHDKFLIRPDYAIDDRPEFLNPIKNYNPDCFSIQFNSITAHDPMHHYAKNWKEVYEILRHE